MEIIKKTLKQIVQEHYPDFSGEVTLVGNKNLELGDYASPVAFAIGKSQGNRPLEVAQALLAPLQQELDKWCKVDVAENAPFLNFSLLPEAWEKIQAEESPKWLAGKKAIVEFISANPTGPLTLANGRGGYSGDALTRVLEFAGAEVTREYYLNDTGNQIAQLGKSILALQNGKEIEDGYKGDYVQELAGRINGDDPQKIGKQAADYILEKWIQPTIARMGIHFDSFFSEDKMVQDGELDEMLKILQNRNLVFKNEGALWLKTTEFGDDKDRVVQRSDGNSTYLLSDIAYHWNKMKRGFDDMVTMVGADHFSEAKTLEMVIREVLIPLTNRKVDFYQPVLQLVRLTENGQEVRMSKRAGTFVTLEELLDTVSSDVARFFFVWHSYRQAMDFDLTLAKQSSDQNPVYYIQYAYVRAKHILAKSDRVGELKTPNFDQDERRLMLHIADFSGTIEQIIKTREVHYLAHYAIELARLFHSFYASHPVLQANEPERLQRLALTKLTFTTLETVLGLIGVSQPERMVS